MKIGSCSRPRRKVRPSSRAGSATFAVFAAQGPALDGGMCGRGVGRGKGVLAGIEW
jgi:hypothetical protein